MLRIQLLGQFRVDYNGEPITAINTLRVQSLLAYLLIHRDAPHSRKHIAFQFYPDSEEEQALTNLRNVLYSLRRVLPESERFLVLDGQNLQWRSDAPYWLDVEEFEKAIKSKDSTESLEQAIGLYQGDLLPDSYEEWVLRERERLHREFRGALERLIALLEENKEYSRALALADRLCAQDDLREDAYGTQMRLLGLMGDRAAIKRVYERLVEKLQRELGVQPSPQTRLAYEQAMRQDSLPPEPPRLRTPGPIGISPGIAPMGVSQMPESPLPVEYRASELQQIVKLLRSGESCAVVGIAGSGKGNLARHLRRQDVRLHYFGGDATQIVVALINCKPMAQRPFGFLYLTALTELAASVAELGGTLTNLVPRLEELSQQALAASPLLAKHFLNQAVAEITSSGAQQVILILDDCDEFFSATESSLFADLRELRDNHKYRLVYLTLTRRELGFLRSDPTEVEEIADLLSGAGHVVFLPPHSKADSFESLRRLAARQNPPSSPDEAELQQLYVWGGGHSALMRALFFATRAKVPWRTPDALEQLAQERDIQAECQKIWDGLEEEERTGLRQLVQRQSAIGDTLERLSRRGLIRMDPKCPPEFLSPIFEKFVATQKPRPAERERRAGFTPRSGV